MLAVASPSAAIFACSSRTLIHPPTSILSSTCTTTSNTRPRSKSESKGKSKRSHKMSAFQTRLASEYSSLFSSGLLAPPRTSFDHDRTPTSSPAASPFSSPMKVGPDADSNALDVGDRAAVDRATTPTPGSYRPLAPPSPSTPASHHAYNRKQENLPPTSRHPQTPSMRRRKSSLSLAASPLPMLKSRPSLVLRARSGSYSSVSSGGSSHGNGHLSMSSLGAGPMTAMPAFMRSGSDGTVGTTNLMGRMRSGSLGGAIR
jgi:hypothetical protein